MPIVCQFIDNKITPRKKRLKERKVFKENFIMAIAARLGWAAGGGLLRLIKWLLIFVGAAVAIPSCLQNFAKQAGAKPQAAQAQHAKPAPAPAPTRPGR